MQGGGRKEAHGRSRGLRSRESKDAASDGVGEMFDNMSYVGETHFLFSHIRQTLKV
jgi:hypothetical protein